MNYIGTLAIKRSRIRYQYLDEPVENSLKMKIVQINEGIPCIY